MDEPLPEVTRSDLADTLEALIILLAAVALAWIVAVVAPGIIRRLAGPGRAVLAPLIESVRWPAFALIVVQGLFLALRHPGYMATHRGLLDRLWIATVVVFVLIGVIRAIRAWFHWYRDRAEAHPGPGRIEPRILDLIRRGLVALVIVLGGLVLLDVLGLEITPLIAGLGIGGLAVGLALQPVLSSIFASSSMISDSSLRVGDLVEVEGGPTGTVEHIGWRATRVRDFDNNIVLIPNAKLADSTFTNYTRSSFQADARLMFRVAYEEDLDHVEEVVVDELTRVRDGFEAAVKTYEPLFLYREFGPSNIDVLVKLRAMTWFDSFTLQHLMVKGIHARLRAEGIVINYPSRRLLLHEADMGGLTHLLERGNEIKPAASIARYDSDT